MKKKIIAAAACAAMVLSLTACGKSEEPVSGLSNPIGSSSTSSTSSTPVSSSAQTSSAASAPAESKPEESSAPAQPTANENDYEWVKQMDGYGNVEIISISYKGSDENVVFPSTLEGIPVLKVSGFGNNIDITSVTIPDGIESIDSGAFADCLNLKEVTFLGKVPEFDLSSFENTPWLEAKLAENTNPDFAVINNVLVKADGEKIEGAVTIPDGVTRICRHAFEDCIDITSVTIPDSVTEIGYAAFFGCKKLSSVKLPAGITKIAGLTFSICRSLESIDIPNGVTMLGHNAFDMCSAVVNLPDSIIYDDGSGIAVAKFKGKTYENCSFNRDYKYAISQNAIDIEFGGKDFIITDNVLMKINPNATKIELPDTVKGIDDKAAEGCDQSIIITFKGKNYNLANLDKLKADVSGS